MGILALRPYKILVQNVIHYLDAGPDQYAICTNNITLTATVIGDLAGHVLLWEQISGNTLGVTVTSPTNELTLTYTNTVLFQLHICLIYSISNIIIIYIINRSYSALRKLYI